MTRRIGVILTVLAGGLGAMGWALTVPADDAPAPGQAEYEGLIQPSRTAQLTLRASGVIAVRPVSEGDRVKAGDLIAELDSELEKAALEVSRLKAESEHELRAAQMSEKQALVELGRVQDLFDRKVATKWELEEAKVKAEIARVRTEFAQFQRKLAAQELARDQVALAQRRLVAPFEGVIRCPEGQRRLKEVGEGVQSDTPVAELSKLDPLLVEVNVPVGRRPYVRVGQTAAVRTRSGARDASVIMVDQQNDASSDTFRVRLELPNADSGFTAGERPTVTFKFIPDNAARADE